MVLKEPVESGSLGVSGTIHGGRIRNVQAIEQPRGIGVFSPPRRSQHKTRAACHGKP